MKYPGHGQLARWIKWTFCDIGEAKGWLENELWCRWSNGRVWRMSCDVGKATEELEKELWRRWRDGEIGEWAELIDIEIYSRALSPTFPSLHLRHSSFSYSSVALPTSELILQPFRCFAYVTAHSPTLLSLLLHHRLFTYVTWRGAHAL